MIKLPVAVVDFEASSLSLESYPIEVGIAIATDPAIAPESWSTLIRPTADWSATGDWDTEAEQTHRISLSELGQGSSPLAAAQTMNQLLKPYGAVYSDGGQYDGHWLRTLYQAAGIKPTFVLWDIAALFVLDRRMHNRFADALTRTVAPHRAGPDAARVCSALIEAGGLREEDRF